MKNADAFQVSECNFSYLLIIERLATSVHFLLKQIYLWTEVFYCFTDLIQHDILNVLCLCLSCLLVILFPFAKVYNIWAASNECIIWEKKKKKVNWLCLYLYLCPLKILKRQKIWIEKNGVRPKASHFGSYNHMDLLKSQTLHCPFI